MPGVGELVIILVIVVLLFGASRIPKVGDALGKGIRNFSKGLSGKSEEKIEDSQNAHATERKPTDNTPAS